ncbi:Hexokinase-1 [Lucilia cuprina]|nr:Hexokinase-1 [Lucilia cuprina]
MFQDSITTSNDGFIKGNEKPNRRIIEELCQPLQLDFETLTKVKELFLKDLKMGLGKNTNAQAVVKCFLTYVQKLPTGCEKGRCLVLDLGGSNFRVVLMNFDGQMKYKITVEKFHIPDNLLEGSGLNLFNFVAECLSNFVKNLNLHMEEMPLAFSFAFPIKQKGLHEGELVGWGKNFNLPDVIGRNVVELLQEAVERRGQIKISTYVLMNDTTAVLMSCAFKNHYGKIGVIMDNGCNACYLEQVKYITTFQDNNTIPTIPTMVINTEWGFFGDNGSLDFIRTNWDLIIDAHSTTRTKRTFEKMVAGLYLGALVRLIMLDCIKSAVLLQGELTSELKKTNSFQTSYVFDIESQSPGSHYITREILHILGYRKPSNADCENVRFICKVVSKRSADLVAATLACLIDRIFGDPFITIGIDGNIFRCHSLYEKYLREKLRNLVKPEHKFDFIVSEAGTGCGAALVAIGVAKHNRVVEKRKSRVTNCDVILNNANEKLPKQKSKNRDTILEICKPLVLDDETLRKVKDLFLNDIKMGLCKATNPQATVKCWVTYVQSLPTGCETGKFLALDLGGTNFRVLCIHLEGQTNFRMDFEVYAIPEKLLVGPGRDLFDHIAECLAKFVKTLGAQEDEVLPMGFTFSFPLKQTGLIKGELVAWTKGFNCPGVVGRDVVELLREALDRRGDIKVGITAILNDTTGTLMSCAWKNPNCKIGLIVGTGSNACYLEQIKNIDTFEPEPNNRVPTMIINCEWGAFGDKGCLEFVRTKYDRQIDETTHNRGRQIFEKMLSGMYLGELVRLIMLDCCKAGALFKGNESEQLRKGDSFKTKYISQIEEENRGTYVIAREILEILGYKSPTDGDCENVRYICECISRRSAHLVAANLACLIDRIGDPYVVVGIDGSVYRFHPHYHNLLTQKIKCLARPEHKFDLMLSEDGSGRGAALVAAVAARIKSKEKERDEEVGKL